MFLENVISLLIFILGFWTVTAIEFRHFRQSDRRIFLPEKATFRDFETNFKPLGISERHLGLVHL